MYRWPRKRMPGKRIPHLPSFGLDSLATRHDQNKRGGGGGVKGEKKCDEYRDSSFGLFPIIPINNRFRVKKVASFAIASIVDPLTG